MKRKKKGFLIVFLLLLLAAAVGFIIWFIRNQNQNTDVGSDTVFTDSVATLTGVGSRSDPAVCRSGRTAEDLECRERFRQKSQRMVCQRRR